METSFFQLFRPKLMESPLTLFSFPQATPNIKAHSHLRVFQLLIPLPTTHFPLPTQPPPSYPSGFCSNVNFISEAFPEETYKMKAHLATLHLIPTPTPKILSFLHRIHHQEKEKSSPNSQELAIGWAMAFSYWTRKFLRNNIRQSQSVSMMDQDKTRLLPNHIRTNRKIWTLSKTQKWPNLSIFRLM